ncbi:hypothetical protein GCM10023321_50490 [Pseudonocardia eucalypti]|uniref:Uncharacterized protein n=1 Tax=Pseudonocardia eucalypti TaxID=648755 RepID=A0ABP9QKG7_9PSEU
MVSGQAGPGRQRRQARVPVRTITAGVVVAGVTGVVFVGAVFSQLLTGATTGGGRARSRPVVLVGVAVTGRRATVDRRGLSQLLLEVDLVQHRTEHHPGEGLGVGRPGDTQGTQVIEGLPSERGVVSLGDRAGAMPVLVGDDQAALEPVQVCGMTEPGRGVFGVGQDLVNGPGRRLAHPGAQCVALGQVGPVGCFVVFGAGAVEVLFVPAHVCPERRVPDAEQRPLRVDGVPAVGVDPGERVQAVDRLAEHAGGQAVDLGVREDLLPLVQVVAEQRALGGVRVAAGQVGYHVAQEVSLAGGVRLVGERTGTGPWLPGAAALFVDQDKVEPGACALFAFDPVAVVNAVLAHGRMSAVFIVTPNFRSICFQELLVFNECGPGWWFDAREIAYLEGAVDKLRE